MKILVIGSGGREHALVWSFAKHDPKREIYCANGNAGISEYAKCVDISPDDNQALCEFALDNDIGMTFVGGETSLANGIVDIFEAKGLRIVGPSRSAARLEASKSFAKDFMDRHSIPTARSFHALNATEAINTLNSGYFGDESAPVVVKADGLAAGKGVVVASNRAGGIAAINAIFSGEVVSQEAAASVVLEECLFGTEVSLLLFTDGESFKLMPPTRDHKRIGEFDTGANTGGMGTITDLSLLTRAETNEIVKSIVTPTLEGAANEGFPIKGVLFLGLMMTEKGPKVLEYNIRFGDPETQAILVNLETDIAEISNSIVDRTLSDLKVLWKDGSSACVVIAAENYPKSPKTGDIIEGLDEAGADECVKVFHAGTKLDTEGRIVTSGGRVLGVTATASNLANAIHRSYKAANKISWDGMYFRRDIGRTGK